MFVHGVLGDSQSTWTNKDTKAYWPSLMAGDPDFDDFDIFVVGYPSEYFRSSYTADQLVDVLRRDFDSAQIFAKHKHVYFLCHSMGGQLVRKYLIRYRSSASQVPMIYFFSTPTTGAEIANLAKLLSPNRQFGSLMPTKEANEYLDSIQQDWLAARFSIASYCAYETQDTYGTRVVDKSSATTLCNRRLDPINANHIDIVKPRDAGDAPYTVFRNALQEERSEKRAPQESQQKPLARISKSSSFSTIVPVLTVPSGRPVRRIPFDENFRDPRSRFYLDLDTLSQRPFVNPPGVTYQEKPLGDPNVARVFVADLLQYYILREVRDLQNGTMAWGVTKFLGKDTTEMKTIDEPPIPVPDPVPFPVTKLLHILGENEFLNVYSYYESAKDKDTPPGPPGTGIPHWEQMEKNFWQSRKRPFQLPRGTVITLSGNDRDPQRSVQLERPGFYKLKFSVTPDWSNKNSIPEGFSTSSQDVDSYSCRIDMDYEIQQPGSGGFTPILYAQWADNLFAGMKKAMAP